MLPVHIFAEVQNAAGGTVVVESDDQLPDVLYSVDFLYRIKFTAETKALSEGGGAGGGTPPTTPAPGIVPAVSLSCAPPALGITCRNVDVNVLEISGSYRTAFDDSYQFVRKTGELVVLPPDTTDGDIALVRYTMPSSSRQTFEYNINIVWALGAVWEGTPISTNVVMRQQAFWNTASAAGAISRLKNLKF